jgi:hypothetical protein
MEHKKELDELHKKSLDKIDEYLKTKKNLSEEHHEKLNEAKNKWQASWTELKQFLMYLETLEI